VGGGVCVGVCVWGGVGIVVRGGPSMGDHCRER
jgi:hypothetical protein